MKIRELEIKGSYEIELLPHEDQRGFFMRTYDDKLWKQHGIDRPWVNENHSFSLKKGTIRGLHIQSPPHTETKLFRVVEGELFFAFVDLRRNSPTFGAWESLILSAENKNIAYVPKGCAPGICTLTDNCHFLLKTDAYYAPDASETILWNDKDIGIAWPISTLTIISQRDAQAISFKQFLAKYPQGIEVR